MTYKRLNNLFLAIICFLFCLLVLSTAARAEVEWHPALYGTLKVSSGSGYENPGYGITGEIQARYKWAEVKAYGSYNWEHKKGADSGNTYNIGGQLRGYFYDGFYGLGAVQWSGYHSEFPNHGPWQKSGTNLGLGAGYSQQDLDIYLVYFFQENGSPNKVSFLRLYTRFQIWKWLWGLVSFGPEWFEQTPGGGRTSFSFQGGIGVRW